MIVKMERVEVDPKLFVTCRLCLEDMGIYQIIPNIQHQIKYCFDIDVAPFDGLPQLICKKCEPKLSEYFTLKTAYVAKQQILISTLQNKSNLPVLTKTAALVSSQAQVLPTDNQTHAVQEVPKKIEEDPITDKNIDQENSPPVVYQKTEKKKRRRIVSTSSASSDSKHSDGKVKPLIIKKTKIDKRRRWHTADYNKHFSCRFCNKSYVKKNCLFKHYKSSHSMYLKKYNSILNSICTVQIEKVDNKPNFTGASNTVVFSKDKVTVNDKSSKYYTVYTSKSQNFATNDFPTQTNANELSEFSDDCTDAEYSVAKRKGRKRRRFLSSDTVVIEKKDDNEKNLSEIDDLLNCGLNHKRSEVITECINLDSDSEPESVSKTKITDSKFEENIDNTLIHNIIDVCHSKYVRNMVIEKGKRPNYASVESQLMHKVLNMGRKIINRQGLNCTGLLRFLEYRNMGVIWLSKTSHAFVGPPVRISMTTLKKDHQKPEDNDVGWTDVPFTSNIYTSIDSNLDENLISLKESNRNDSSIVAQISNDFNNIESIENNDSQLKTLLNQNDNLVNVSQAQNSSWDDQACLYKNDDASSSGKLLNKNPVANPKQLPKKVIHYEIKPNKNILDGDVELQLQNKINDGGPVLFSDPHSETDTDLTGMPIITSTTSLATDYQQNKNESKENNPVSANSNTIRSPVSVPRIKVKPVSELMPENVSTPNSLLLNQNNIGLYDQSLPNMTQFIQMQPQNIAQPMLQLQGAAAPVSVVQMPVPAVNNTFSEDPKNYSEYIILDTAEMPNTNTNSPFRYLKTLLEIHNIILLEAINTNDFHCLIKFKVLFKQEAVKPIVLCLSLHCDTNKFYIGIKDSTNINIDMQKISANWQWEIIKIFQGDVCNKINQTALKLGLQILENSKKFLCLVKSIQLKKL